ncbi:MAG: hypothetical protein KIS84_07805 [Dokdonella sp.]|nr:hypothetical protein [Dokdonella sp.]
MGKIAGSIALAIGMALTATTVVAASDPGVKQSPDIRFFLADPELGVAGVYGGNGAELYFEARRSLDATGAAGALSLRIVDAEARTVAIAGEPLDGQRTPISGEFDASEGYVHARQLTGLGRALGAADLHAALTVEKSALADLARQAADTAAANFPLRASLDARFTEVASDAQVADFYMRSMRDVQAARADGGMLEASLGNGIVLRSKQEFIADEPDEHGNMGRIDAYVLVKAADGYVLGAELGGDRVPKDWSDDMELENERSHHDLAADFGRAATALNALAYSGRTTQGVTLSHQAEQASMQRLAQSLASNLLPERADASNQLLAAGLYQTAIEVWRKPFLVLAEHSATRVAKYRYNNPVSNVRTFQGWISFCNHGACANASNMSRKCSYTGPRGHYYLLPSRRSDAGGHTCATPYWAIGRIGHHNCHDDSSVQVRAVHGQYYSIYTGRCGDAVYWAHAPHCGAQ